MTAALKIRTHPQFDARFSPIPHFALSFLGATQNVSASEGSHLFDSRGDVHISSRNGRRRKIASPK
jgi:hypothetical protein